MGASDAPPQQPALIATSGSLAWSRLVEAGGGLGFYPRCLYSNLETTPPAALTRPVSYATAPSPHAPGRSRDPN